jgi:methyl-accepting chemotaxis protein
MFIEALASVQFQDIVRQQLTQVIEGIERIDAHTQTVAGLLQSADDYASADPQIKSLKGEFESLYSSYVMDHQRDTHKQSLASSRRPASAAKVVRTSHVELF